MTCWVSRTDFPLEGISSLLQVARLFLFVCQYLVGLASTVDEKAVGSCSFLSRNLFPSVNAWHKSMDPDI